ncbi:MAG: tetratricopeptide repeat protein [Gemmatimonadaceae bacterium]
MSEVLLAAAGPRHTASTPAFVATIVGVIVAILLLLGLDLSIASIDRRESTAHAESEYSAGRALLVAGHPEEAISRFGAAVAIDRKNVNYALALGEAYLEAGNTSDAEATVSAVLQRNENDGAVNLTMAEIMKRESKWVEAEAFYHRANFGRWGADSVAQRARARFELIDLLSQHGSPRELLAELLPFEETSPDSIMPRTRLGQLFIVAGAPSRAVGVFREVLRQDPHNAAAHAGLGQAALALGNFRTARADLAEAARLEPGDTTIANSLAVADTVLSLDPTAVGIDGKARIARSRELLARTIATVSACPESSPTAALDAANAALSVVPGRGLDDASGEAMIAAAGDLWAARPTSCAAVARDTILRLLHARLAA